MTGVLVVLAVLSAVGGFIPVPALPRAAAAAAGGAARRFDHFETPLIVALGRARAGRPGRGRRSCSAARRRRASACARAFAGLHRWLVGQVLRRRALRARLGRPLLWISDRVFLRLGDRCDPRRHAERPGRDRPRQRLVLGRLQTGSLHLYALVRAGRHRRRAALELAPCLTPRCSTSSSSCRCSASALLIARAGAATRSSRAGSRSA